VAAPVIDASQLPIVVVRFNGYISDPEFDVYLATMTGLLTRNSKMVAILDARAAIRNPPSQRQKQADWIRANEELLRQHSLGTAFVLTSPLVRGVMNAILWLQPLPTEYTVVGTLEEAERWAEDRLQSAGSSVAQSASRSR
jgi:hypothetical protein